MITKQQSYDKIYNFTMEHLENRNIQEMQMIAGQLIFFAVVALTNCYSKEVAVIKLQSLADKIENGEIKL